MLLRYENGMCCAISVTVIGNPTFASVIISFVRDFKPS